MSSESLAPQVLRRINRETGSLRVDPPEGIRVIINEDDLADVRAWVAGPPGTPYEGGFFKVRFSFGGEYPAAPPKCTFGTKLFHPNVGPSGEICVNTLKKDWQPAHTLSHILLVIKCLLIYPNPESALDEEAGRLLLERYEDFAARAKLVTKVHGNVGRRPAEFDVESKSEKEARLAAQKAVSTSMTASASCCDPGSITHSPVIPVNPLQPSSTSNVPTAFSDSGLNSGAVSVPMVGVLSSGGSSTSSTLSKKRSVGTALGASATTAGGNAGMTAVNASTGAPLAQTTGNGAAKKGLENEGAKVATKKAVAAAGQAKKRGLKRL